MRSYKTQGIIIKRINFGEADRILTIFTKRYGKIKAIAKGVRRITSRRGGNLEVFNLVTVFLTEGRNFEIVTEAEVVKSFLNLRKNLKKVGLAYYFCELVESLCPEKQENERVFELLSKILEDLEEEREIREIREMGGKKYFEINLLKELGYLSRDSGYKDFNLKIYLENILQRKLKSERVLNIIS